MPDYTTDTHDHAREEAENRANERLEAAEEEARSAKVAKNLNLRDSEKNLNLSESEMNLKNLSRSRLHSYDVVDPYEASSEEDDYDDDEEDFGYSASPVMFNDLDSLADTKLPSPPTNKSLMQLVAMMADRF